MTERSVRLGRQLDAELDRMARFVSALTPGQVQAPCADPQGDTVSGVLAHLRDGTEQVVEWADRITGGGAPGPAHGHGHDHAHGHDHTHDHEHDPAHDEPADPQGEIERTVTMLRTGGDRIVLAVTSLSDEQLDVVPPATPGLADGVMTLQRIIEFICEDLEAHRAHLQAAVGASTPVAR